ncbi:MAG: hypothetical protein OYL92_10945 [Acidobacteriota bacterium]|nr:hypothetical protein [Acidobacteriota bacterium]MDE3265473.1 hypothetical protein [Acidobacteriota bacterium]
MPRRDLRSRDEERYLEALDEAGDRVRLARRDYHEALDDLEKLEAVGPEGPDADPALDGDLYGPRRRGRPSSR